MMNCHHRERAKCKLENKALCSTQLDDFTIFQAKVSTVKQSPLGFREISESRIAIFFFFLHKLTLGYIILYIVTPHYSHKHESGRFDTLPPVVSKPEQSQTATKEKQKYKITIYNTT